MAEVEEWVAGKVASSNPKGVKLQGENDYHNWSKHGTPPEDQRPVPPRGSGVRLGLDKDGFIREMTDADRKPLGQDRQVAAAPGTSYGITDDDKRRMTLLSTLRSAAILLGNLGMPEVAEGAQAPAPSRLTMQVARVWAKEVAPDLFGQRPAPVQNGQQEEAG